jgi:epoxyqueuosine reductase
MPWFSISPNSARFVCLQKPVWCLRFAIVRLHHTPEHIDDAYVASLRAVGLKFGLDHVGIAPASVMSRAREALVQRKQAGLADSMEFTYRNPTRSTDPALAVAGARAMVVAARSYVLDEPKRPDHLYGPIGAVARYAWVDHYEPLRIGLQAIVTMLRSSGYKAVAFADDNSVVDREAAWLAGLGWFGKNANILLPGSGSFFVLGSVITTAALPPAIEPMADGCGTCVRCIDGCPTAAIVAPGVVDAGRCLAWLLQRPGVFPRHFRVALGNRIYGCDECQLVCPPTVRFGRSSDSNQSKHTQAWVPLVDMLEASDESLLQSYGRWYLADRNPIWLRRNALIALGNVGDGTDACVAALLQRYLVHSEPMLRAHAVWAAARLGCHYMLPMNDPDPIVIDELVAARE